MKLGWAVLIVLGLLATAGCSNRFGWDNPLDPSNSAVHTPYYLYPGYNAEMIPISFEMQWSGGDPDAGDTVIYQVYLDTISPPAHVICSGSARSCHIQDLNWLTTYYWMIRSTDNHGIVATSDVWRFQTKYNSPPSIPSDPTPSCGATAMQTIMYGAWIGWTCSDPDTEDTVRYDVYADTLNPPSVRIIQGVPGGGPFLRGESNRTYYWYVRAYDNHGAEAIGPVWNLYLVWGK